MTIETFALPRTDRRAFLFHAAGVAAGSVVLATGGLAPTPAQAIQPTPDPILEAIEAHRSAAASAVALVADYCALETEIPPERRRSHLNAWQANIVATDDPRWIDNQHNLAEAWEAESEAALGLVNVRPTTAAGIVAVIQYAVEADKDGCTWPDDLVSDDGKRSRSWQYFLLQNLAEALGTDAVRR